MKKITAVFLAVLILVTITCTSAFAQNELRPIEEVIREAIVNFKDSVDVSAYGYYGQEGVDTIYEEAYYGVYQTYGDTFHYDPSSADFVLSPAGLVKEFKLKYIYTPEEVKLVKDLAEEYIFSQVDDSWSDMEKALFFHDYLCQHFQYDIRLFFKETQNDVARDIYRMFTEGMGVCQAYANAYEYLLQHEGIECRLVASDQSNHEWNIVKIDGVWYHVDVTQDDPLILIDEDNIALLDMAGRVSHKYFLLSDNGIYDYYSPTNHGDHYNWYCINDKNKGVIPCNSTKYENGWLFSEANVALCYYQDYWYYTRHNADQEKVEFVKTADLKTGSVFYTISSVWALEEDAYYNYMFTGLSVVNGYLIYNTDKNVVAYNLRNNTEKNLFSLQDISTRNDLMATIGEPYLPILDCYIYGTRADKDGVYCQISYNYADYTYYIAAVPSCTFGHADCEWVVTKEATGWSGGLEEKICQMCLQAIDSRVLPAKGDTNFDGEVNVVDLAILKKVVAGISETMDVDLNDDDKTDVVDLALLKKFVAGIISEI